MNWDAIGAISELIGAFAVVVTLIFLAVQLRHGASSINEANRLNRVGAVDRHNDTISRWRGRLMENEDLARIWLSAYKDEQLSELDWFRCSNLFVDFANTQRANFVRARVVGEEGLARIAAMSVAVEIRNSRTLKEHWRVTQPFMELVSVDFVNAVNAELDNVQNDSGYYKPRPAFDPGSTLAAESPQG